MWNIRSIKVIPVVVGALGSTSKKLKKCIEELDVVISTALERSFARDSLYIKEGFRLRIRFVETGLGWFDKEKNNTIKITKNKKANGQTGRGREVVPKTEQVRKSVKV